MDDAVIAKLKRATEMGDLEEGMDLVREVISNLTEDCPECDGAGCSLCSYDGWVMRDGPDREV